jgi:signal transduction histidine kinase
MGADWLTKLGRGLGLVRPPAADQRAELIDYSRMLARVLDLQDLRAALEAYLARVVGTRGLRVFATDETGEHLVEILPSGQAGEPERLETAALALLESGAQSGAFTPEFIPRVLVGTEVLAPLRTEGRLVGLASLGPKDSGQPYTDEERGFVNAVAAQTAVAFDRARALKRVQDVNLGLEQKVFERTQQLAEANDRLAEQFARLEKLDEMKEALTRMVVHDLKNPVATILLGLEFLERGKTEPLPEHVQHILDIISATMRDIQDLITNLLDLNRMEAGELALDRQAIRLAELAAAAARRVEMLARHRQVRVRIEEREDCRARVDPGLLTRLLVNLLSNAAKHATRGSDVQLEIAPESAGGVCLAVTNQGPNIPAELHGRVFEKFFQAGGDRSGILAGTGLGLAFCRLVAEAHGGAIGLESPPEGLESGARFWVRLPGDEAARS